MVNAEKTVPSLSNVHEAVRLAVLESKEQQSMVPANFKLPPQIKAAAEMILKHQGTDLSKFLRACAELIVRDYAGDQGLAKIMKTPIDGATEGA